MVSGNDIHLCLLNEYQIKNIYIKQFVQKKYWNIKAGETNLNFQKYSESE